MTVRENWIHASEKRRTKKAKDHRRHDQYYQHVISIFIGVQFTIIGRLVFAHAAYVARGDGQG